MVAADGMVHLCENIGPAERAKRNRIGVFFTAVTVLAAGALLETHAPFWVRLTIALPAMIAAMGFLQARAHTCVAFAAANIKVMGDSRADKVDVTTPLERAAFRKKARVIYAQGLGATAVVVALFMLIP